MFLLNITRVYFVSRYNVFAHRNTSITLLKNSVDKICNVTHSAQVLQKLIIIIICHLFQGVSDSLLDILEMFGEGQQYLC